MNNMLTSINNLIEETEKVKTKLSDKAKTALMYGVPLTIGTIYTGNKITKGIEAVGSAIRDSKYIGRG